MFNRGSTIGNQYVTYDDSEKYLIDMSKMISHLQIKGFVIEYWS